ncbi:MAG TPA: hypothetical protein VJC10_00400 [Patescibacteria group bacterium]|nr:hypothetical protein [Patescibacteria group bacterium]
MLEQLKQNKQFFILLVVAFVMALVLLGIALVSLFSKQNPPSSQMPPPYHKTVIGTTKEDAIEALPKKKNVQTFSDNSKQYSFTTRNLARDDVIITKDNTVIFEKTITVTESLVHPKISELLKQYGAPEKTVLGSKTYGSRVIVYIYATMGVVFVGKPSSGEVLELQQFIPMSVDEYLSSWGKDAGYEDPGHEKL